MVINRAARHTRSVGHFGQRRMTDTSLAKHLLCCIQQLLAGLESFFFSASSHWMSFETMLKRQ